MRAAFPEHHLLHRVGFVIAAEFAKRADGAFDNRRIGVTERAAQRAQQAWIRVEVSACDEPAHHAQLAILLLGALGVQRVENACTADVLLERIELLLPLLDQRTCRPPISMRVRSASSRTCHLALASWSRSWSTLSRYSRWSP